MKSVKPGRGPSAMGAIGAAAAVLFGIIWTAAAASMGAPIFFPLFGLVFIIMGIVQVVYNLKNATGENRFSDYDIVDENEEPDPLNQRFGTPSAPDGPARQDGGELRYCPYCGAELGKDFTFCGRCGKRLPD